MPIFNLIENEWIKYIILGLSTYFTVLIIYILHNKIKHLIDVYEHNTMYSLDENGVRLKEGDWVEVKIVTGAGITNSKNQIIRGDDGYLKCLCIHGFQNLKFFDPQTSVHKLKKIDK